MAITGTEIGQVSIMKGNSVNLPTLPDGVMALTEDERNLYIGTATGINERVGSRAAWGDYTQDLRSGAIAQANAAQSFATSFTNYFLQCANVVRNPKNEFSAGNTFTVSQTGWFVVRAAVSVVSAPASLYCNFGLFINGSYLNTMGANYGAPSGNVQFTGTSIVYATAGQTIKIGVNFSANTITSSGSSDTRIEIIRVA